MGFFSESQKRAISVSLHSYTCSYKQEWQPVIPMIFCDNIFNTLEEVLWVFSLLIAEIKNYRPASNAKSKGGRAKNIPNLCRH